MREGAKKKEKEGAVGLRMVARNGSAVVRVGRMDKFGGWFRG
jgi:hypothetical protein